MGRQDTRKGNEYKWLSLKTWCTYCLMNFTLENNPCGAFNCESFVFQIVVICHTWLACLQDSNFECASEFKPERWLADGVKPSSFLVVPFGSGRRMCPGKRFSEQELQVVLAKVGIPTMVPIRPNLICFMRLYFDFSSRSFRSSCWNLMETFNFSSNSCCRLKRQWNWDWSIGSEIRQGTKENYAELRYN